MVVDGVVLEVDVVLVVEVVVPLDELHPVGNRGASRIMTQRTAQ